MPVIKHNQVPVIAEYFGEDYFAVAKSVSISYAASLEPSRILAPNQNNNFRIGGPTATKISINMVADKPSQYPFPSLLFEALTGDRAALLKIGSSQFSSCYCSSARIDISPFAPILISAEFISNNPPINQPFVGTTNEPPSSSLSHGYKTLITNGDLLSDKNYSSISYQVSCNRTPVFNLGEKFAQKMFLDSVEKELSIKATNIGNFIDYTGYGDVISIDVKADDNSSIFIQPLSMSSNSRIVSQNISMEEGGILAGDISLREIVL
jgi:hypothetical protein